MSEHMKTDETSVRVNVRIPRRTYDLMRRLGDTLGLETDSACLKHFLLVGIQASAGGIASINAADTSALATQQIIRMNDNVDRLEA